ncbi:MAG TPA: PEP-CTERM system TPR-repeat protein PrsT [Gammaproteobacteria bacterium]|nr:PEP-CTERM system TPR-repeat protein PrsT [Gammaproteobacteria bacterium]
MSDWKLSQLALIALLLALLNGCGTDVVATLERAQKLEQAGNLTGAIIELKAALQQDPDSVEKRFMLGRLYNAAFDAVAAEKELRNALDRGETFNGRIPLELARALRTQGKFKELVAEVPVDANFEPEILASIYSLRGRAQHTLGNKDEAVQSLELARKLEPRNNDAALLDAQIKGGEGDLAGALLAVEHALDRAPEFYDGWVYRAEILRALGRTEDAIAAYGKVLSINPNNALALIRRSTLLVGQGMLEKAQADVALLLRSTKENPFAYVQQGVVALAGGKARAALDAAQSALRIAPKLMTANLLAGLSHHALGSFELAVPFLKAALADSPNNVLAARALAESHLRLDEPSLALKVLEPMLAAEIADAGIYAVAGEAYTALGEQAKAQIQFQKAAALAPEDPRTQLQLALAAVAAGEETGLTELREALQKAKVATRADEALVVSLLAKRELEQASEAVDALAKRAPDDPVTWNLRGLVLASNGEFEAASSAFEKALELDNAFLPATKNLVQIELRGGDIGAARERIRRAAEADPKNLDVWLTAAQLELKFGDRTKAREALERAAQVAPNVALPKSYLARLYLEDRDFQQASEYANQALALNTRDPTQLMLAATALQADGNINQANRLIEQLIGQNQRSEWAYLEAAKFYSSSGQRDLANKVLLKALDVNPKYAATQLAWTSALVQENRIDDALNFAKSIQVKQDKAPIGFLLEGEIYEAAQKYENAAGAYEKALKRQPHGILAYKLFGARARAGHDKEALHEFEAWVELHPEDYDAQSKLGDVYLALGRSRDAVKCYEKALESGTATAELLNNLANAYHAMADSRALPLAEAAFRADAHSPWINDTLGWITLDQGDVQRALRLLLRASALAPNEPEIRYHVAVALEKIGQKDQARKQLSVLLDDDSREFPSRMAAKELRARLN